MERRACLPLRVGLVDSVNCRPGERRPNHEQALHGCRHGERRPNQEQALHDVVKRGDRRESEAATGALAEPEGPGERAGRRARGQARRGAKEEDTVFGS